MQSKLSCLWKEPGIPQRFRTAVSLHGHTNRSKEGLSFISKFIGRHTLLQLALAGQKAKAKRRASVSVDFEKAFWRPPLSPLAAYRLELNQIEVGLGLVGLVSLSDHDNIEAPTQLQVLPQTRAIPISVEWSVPYKRTTVHLGIHNLPPDKAEGFMVQFTDYAANPSSGQLRELLCMLDQDPGVLIVFNHPLWDLKGIGKVEHERLAHDFVAEFGMFVHAFELSGVRRWEENRAVLDFAEAWNQVLVGGGDRHGAEPSAVLNLTNAATFSEFVEEVRKKQRSHLLFMPQYARSFTLRVFLSLLDVIREYPDEPSGNRRWDERVFHPDRHGNIQPMASLWRRPPAYIEAFFAVVRLLEIASIREALLSTLAKPEHEMHITPAAVREVVWPWRRTSESLSFQTHSTKSTAWPTRAVNLRRSRENPSSPS